MTPTLPDTRIRFTEADRDLLRALDPDDHHESTRCRWQLPPCERAAPLQLRCRSCGERCPVCTTHAFAWIAAVRQAHLTVITCVRCGHGTPASAWESGWILEPNGSVS